MRWLSMIAESKFWTREFQLDLKPVGRFLRERPEDVILGIGVVLRVIVYLSNRSMWLDELSLKGNIVDKAVFDFSENLTNDQLAPFGFLIVQRALVRLLGDSNFVMRLVPMIAGILSLFLFAILARRVLPRRAAMVALVLFAFSDDLIYYSSEMKPYAVDLAVGLAITLATLAALGSPASARSASLLAATAALAPWWSFSSAFVVAGCGAVLILESVISGRYRTASIWAMLGLGWLAIFYASFVSSRALLGPYTTMYRFWDFAFIPNHSTLGVDHAMEIVRADVVKAAGILLEIFVNPLYLVAPAWPKFGVILPLVLLQIGELAMARRSWAIYLLLVLPIAMALVAAGYQKYPIHGRLMLELVPALLLLIAEGTEWLARRDRTRSSLLYKAVLIGILAFPCLAGFYHATERRLRNFNPHGDLHNNLFIE
jgi:uncharacterized membrane protein